MRISDWSSDVCSSDLAVLRGLIDADAGAAGGRIDDIDAAVELALGELGATRRIVPRGRRGAGHVLHHLDVAADVLGALPIARSEEHTSELQSLMRISYAVFCSTTKYSILLRSTSDE